MKTLIPMKLGEAEVSLSTSKQVRGMVAALRSTGEFTIDEDDAAGTITAVHTATGREAFAAIQKHEGGPWIVRSMKGLLTLA